MGLYCTLSAGIVGIDSDGCDLVMKEGLIFTEISEVLDELLRLLLNLKVGSHEQVAVVKALNQVAVSGGQAPDIFLKAIYDRSKPGEVEETLRIHVVLSFG
jgi:hypothetical protein